MQEIETCEQKLALRFFTNNINNEAAQERCAHLKHFCDTTCSCTASAKHGYVRQYTSPNEQCMEIEERLSNGVLSGGEWMHYSSSSLINRQRKRHDRY